MCGRYSVQKKTLLVANGLVKKNINVDLEQDNFNCAPGGKYPCIKSATNGKYLEMTLFGILPSWAKPDFRRLHNARLEGIETKVSFKKLIVNSRAVIPITGFYEWQKVGEKTYNGIRIGVTSVGPIVKYGGSVVSAVDDGRAEAGGTFKSAKVVGDGVGVGGKMFSLPGYPAINCVTPEPNCCAASSGCKACLDASCCCAVNCC